MPRVAALYRYPVKGFTPELQAELRVQSDGRVVGDRVLAFRFAQALHPETHDGREHWPKSKGLALMTFPSLARLRTSFDDRERRLRIETDGTVLVDAGLDDAGRAEIVSAVTEYLLTAPDAKRLRRSGVLPLALVGDGETARFQDRPRGFVSLHARASQRELGDAGDERRFRSNVVIDGVDAWQELTWRGRVRISGTAFHVQQPIGRCLATHANPDTGVRDADVLGALPRLNGQPDPTMGVLLLPDEPLPEGGAVIRLGDEVVPDWGTEEPGHRLEA
ncbi:MOSC domain-containing protein [Microbacterium halotolerans]|uniref:MOSC domain-containing protein n=1 Tax=Microbacterium halotolerans TaxID=246613 RepID=UPI000E6ADC37|nr:MOSC domain-containing protein [Microbacterium halotolerans]